MVNTNNSTPQPPTAIVSPQQSSAVTTSTIMTSPTQIQSPGQSSPFPVTVIAQHGNNPFPSLPLQMEDTNVNLYNA